MQTYFISMSAQGHAGIGETMYKIKITTFAYEKKKGAWKNVGVGFSTEEYESLKEAEDACREHERDIPGVLKVRCTPVSEEEYVIAV